MKAAVLGIGTELVEGQTVNKNASWISAKLKEFGLQTSVHIVVPDEWREMTEALDYCANKAEIIFITGGLGPTSDDFTREMVAEWAQKKLIFDETSWQQINDRLTSRGYTVKEIQRRQAYFPEGAQILHNKEGTANAFFIEAHGKKIFVLPGPPREIEAVWRPFIDPWLQRESQNLDSHITFKWDTLGVGESDVALLVEDVLKGQQVEKGYRVHLPYVEVKLSLLRSQEAKLRPLIDKVTEVLSFCTITRNGEDLAETFAEKISAISHLGICDAVTGQFLMNRLMPRLRTFMTEKQWSFSNSPLKEFPGEFYLELKLQEENLCQVHLRTPQGVFNKTFTSPYKTENMRERRHQYFAEMALIFCLQNCN